VNKPNPDKPDRSKGTAGKVSHDARGHAVWQWAAETARNLAITTSQVLRRLDTRSLSLLDDADNAADAKTPAKPPAQKFPGPVRSQAAVKSPVPLKPGQGFDPYESRAKPVARPATHSAAKSPAPAPKPVRASWWQRMLRRG
jgi:hypothetical protein